MRLFTAIDIAPEVKDALARLLDRLRPTARIRWSPADNFHVTTKFIGEWPAERLEHLVAALRELPDRQPIQVAVSGLGWFPNTRSPRVFWAGVQAPPALAALARETDQAVCRLGVPREARSFSPHLTLARIKERTELERLRNEIAALASDHFGEFFADRFRLYVSELGPSGSTYTVLEEFVFARS